MIIIIIIGIIAYLIVGYFYVTKTMDANCTAGSGEIFGILIFIWPILFLGKLIEKLLLRIRLYHPIMKIIFTSLIIVIVVTILVYHFSTLYWPLWQPVSNWYFLQCVASSDCFMKQLFVPHLFLCKSS